MRTFSGAMCLPGKSACCPQASRQISILVITLIRHDESLEICIGASHNEPHDDFLQVKGHAIWLFRHAVLLPRLTAIDRDF